MFVHLSRIVLTSQSAVSLVIPDILLLVTFFTQVQVELFQWCFHHFAFYAHLLSHSLGHQMGFFETRSKRDDRTHEPVTQVNVISRESSTALTMVTNGRCSGRETMSRRVKVRRETEKGKCLRNTSSSSQQQNLSFLSSLPSTLLLSFWSFMYFPSTLRVPHLHAH